MRLTSPLEHGKTWIPRIPEFTEMSEGAWYFFLIQQKKTTVHLHVYVQYLFKLGVCIPLTFRHTCFCNLVEDLFTEDVLFLRPNRLS